MIEFTKGIEITTENFPDFVTATREDTISKAKKAIKMVEGAKEALGVDDLPRGSNGYTVMDDGRVNFMVILTSNNEQRKENAKKVREFLIEQGVLKK